MSGDYTLSFAVPESIRQQLLDGGGRPRREDGHAEEVVPESWFAAATVSAHSRRSRLTGANNHVCLLYCGREDAAEAEEAEAVTTGHAAASTQPASALGEDLAAACRQQGMPSALEVVLYAVDATALLGESRACSVRRRLEAARAVEAAIERDPAALAQLLADGHAHPTTSATAEEDVVGLAEQCPQSLFLLVAGPDRIHGEPPLPRVRHEGEGCLSPHAGHP